MAQKTVLEDQSHHLGVWGVFQQEAEEEENKKNHLPESVSPADEVVESTFKYLHHHFKYDFSATAGRRDGQPIAMKG